MLANYYGYEIQRDWPLPTKERMKKEFEHLQHEYEELQGEPLPPLQENEVESGHDEEDFFKEMREARETLDRCRNEINWIETYGGRGRGRGRK
jgi:hypothetical protein